MGDWVLVVFVIVGIVAWVLVLGHFTDDSARKRKAMREQDQARLDAMSAEGRQRELLRRETRAMMRPKRGIATSDPRGSA